jgi:hypothetical protein
MTGRPILWPLLAMLPLACFGCGKAGSKANTAEPSAVPFGPSTSSSAGSSKNATPAPTWVKHVDVEDGQLCGVGVAGAAFDEYSPYPKEMSTDRAAKNLAGVIETNVQEAIVDKATTSSQSIDMERALMVDDDLVQQVKDMAKTDFWLDADGVGPFRQKSFTYAHSCVDSKMAANTLKVDPKAIAGSAKTKSKKGTTAPFAPTQQPDWIGKTGTQPGNRLCAVGFSLPTFHAENTFEVVIEDIRAQLAEVLQTLVSSYSEDLSTETTTIVEMMTVASTQAISKGAVVTDFWYDEHGIGPYSKRRTTYGWGCVYPIEVMKKTVQSLEKELPKNTVEKVRERAKAAFDDLDAEIEKRAKDGQPRMPGSKDGGASAPQRETAN